MNRQRAPAAPGHDSRTAYDAWHASHPVDAESDAPWHRAVKRHLEPGRDLAGQRVLEVACGRGGFAAWLATRTAPPATLVAADFSPAAVTKARAFAVGLGITRVRWAIADIQAIGHPEATFQTVVCCETIEHVPDPRGALCELARVLRPGGRLYLTSPNYLGPMGLYRGYLRLTGRRFTEEGQPINHPLLLPRTVRWVRRAGLVVLAVDGTGHYLPFPGRPPIELPWIGRPRWLMRWLGLHSLVVARKPGGPQ